MRTARSEINNHVYDTLGEGWYDANANPIALLRAESRLRNPWIETRLRSHFSSASGPLRVLDVGCGGGFLANYLATGAFSVHAIDRSGPSLRVASRHDLSGRVRYQEADAFELPYRGATFDAVCAMDFLEHVENPRAFIGEASRVLRPNGMFFFYTHNRNWLSACLVIKGVRWFVRNTPENLHLYRMFIKPGELRRWCSEQSLTVKELHGVRPCIASSAFAGLLLTRRVPNHFRFAFTRSLRISYVGYAVKSDLSGC